MISLTITVEDITNVMVLFDTIEIRRYSGTGDPDSTVTDIIAATEYTSVSGIDTINSRTGVSDIILSSSYSQYYFTDIDGVAEDWYISRYISSITGTTSSWSSPIQGDVGDLFYNPLFQAEAYYSTSDQLIIDRIRLWTGDPQELKREYGEDALSSIHLDGKTYELDEKGWPISINMGGTQYTTVDDPTVNGYKFLRFSDYVDDVCNTCVTYSGVCGETVIKNVSNGVDIWYNSFRHSDREIMDAYNSCPPPTPLNTSNVTSEAYMLQTSIDLLRKELWEDATENGAVIKDEGSHYDPSKGLEVRKKLLDDLQKRLDKLVNSLLLSSITGVLID